MAKRLNSCYGLLLEMKPMRCRVRFCRRVLPVAGGGAAVAASLAVLALLLLSLTARAEISPPAPKHLRPETVSALERYVRLTEARNDEELRRGAPLFWFDSLPEKERAAAYAELRRGVVKMQELKTTEAGRGIACPDGMIHHWAGVIFIPGATLEETLKLLQDYDHHSSYYAPDVERSRIKSRDADQFRIFLRFRRHKVITVVLDTEHEVQYFQDSSTRAHSRSSAVRIAQVENAGRGDEREKPPGDDDGFLWRMETWWRMEERDGGVYVQSEVVSLTRDIPAVLSWLIGPFVKSIPHESLTFTLEATRRGVEARRHTPANPAAR